MVENETSGWQLRENERLSELISHLSELACMQGCSQLDQREPMGELGEKWNAVIDWVIKMKTDALAAEKEKQERPPAPVYDPQILQVNIYMRLCRPARPCLCRCMLFVMY